MEIDVDYRKGLVPDLEDYGRAVVEITEGDEVLGWCDLYGLRIEDGVPIFQGCIETFRQRAGVLRKLIFQSQRALEKICKDNGDPLIHEESFSKGVAEDTPEALIMLIETLLCNGYQFIPVPEKDKEFTYAQMRKRFEPE